MTNESKKIKAKTVRVGLFCDHFDIKIKFWFNIFFLKQKIKNVFSAKMILFKKRPNFPTSDLVRQLVLD